jgi:hypothetical protein
MISTQQRPAAEIAFSIRLPEDWLPLDLEGDRIPVQVERLVATAAAADPAIDRHRSVIEKQIREALREARAADLSFCAVLAKVIDDVLPLAASFTIALRNPPADAGDLLTGVRRIPNAIVGEFEIPDVGTVARARYVTRSPSGSLGNQPVDVSVTQYFVRPPRGRRIAIITASTPVLVLADEFAELFDSMVRTFAFEPVAPDLREAPHGGPTR